MMRRCLATAGLLQTALAAGITLAVVRGRILQQHPVQTGTSHFEMWAKTWAQRLDRSNFAISDSRLSHVSGGDGGIRTPTRLINFTIGEGFSRVPSSWLERRTRRIDLPPNGARVR